jgi:hypothetical protein
VWDEAILDAIETSRVFLLILSKSANPSHIMLTGRFRLK